MFFFNSNVFISVALVLAITNYSLLSLNYRVTTDLINNYLSTCTTFQVQNISFAYLELRQSVATCDYHSDFIFEILSSTSQYEDQLSLVFAVFLSASRQISKYYLTTQPAPAMQLPFQCSFHRSTLCLTQVHKYIQLDPVAARSKAQVYGRSPVEIVGSNPTRGMDVCLL